MNAPTLLGHLEELTRPVPRPQRRGTPHSERIGVNVVSFQALAAVARLRTADLVLVEAYLHTTRAEPSSPRWIEVVATRLQRLAPAPDTPNSAAEPAQEARR